MLEEFEEQISAIIVCPEDPRSCETSTTTPAVASEKEGYNMESDYSLAAGAKSVFNELLKAVGENEVLQAQICLPQVRPENVWACVKVTPAATVGLAEAVSSKISQTFAPAGASSVFNAPAEATKSHPHTESDSDTFTESDSESDATAGSDVLIVADVLKVLIPSM